MPLKAKGRRIFMAKLFGADIECSLFLNAGLLQDFYYNLEFFKVTVGV